MGEYELDGGYAFDIPRYVYRDKESNVYWMYRAFNGEDGRWIIVLGEDRIADKQGVLLTESLTNDTPLGARWLYHSAGGDWLLDETLTVVVDPNPLREEPNRVQEFPLEPWVYKSEYDVMFRRAEDAEQIKEVIHDELMEMERRAETLSARNKELERTIAVVRDNVAKHGTERDEARATAMDLKRKLDAQVKLAAEIEAKCAEASDSQARAVQSAALAACALVLLGALGLLARLCRGGASKGPSNPCKKIIMKSTSTDSEQEDFESYRRRSISGSGASMPNFLVMNEGTEATDPANAPRPPDVADAGVAGPAKRRTCRTASRSQSNGI